MEILYLNLVGFAVILLTVLLLIPFSIKLVGCVIKKKPFPKKLFSTILLGMFVVLLQASYSKYFFTFDTDDGEFYKGPVNSPTEKYTANAYYMTYGGAAGGVNLWVEITYNEENHKSKTLYYSDAKSNFSMEWVNENTLRIVNEEPEWPDSNRSITLNVDEEIYHDTGRACQSLLLKNSYETCYQN